MKNYAFVFAIFALLLLAGCAQTQTPPSGQPPAQIAISIVSVPSTAETGKPVELKWRVAGPSTTTTHTAIHYGYSSVLTDPTPAKYAFKTQIKSGPLPADFSDVVTFAQPGTVYYRAHVIVEGKHYWTDEGTIIVSGAAQAPDLSGLDNADAGVQQAIDELDQVK